MRKTNDAGIELIKSFEALRLNAYQDSVGVWTIGWGHTGGVKRGDHISRETAEELFRDDLDEFEAIVEDAVTVDLTDNQFAALVSFAFNVGPGKKNVKDGFVTLKSGRPPTMLRLLNEGDYTRAADELLKWNRAGGKVLAGLTRRRKAERALFLTPDATEPALEAPPKEATTSTEIVKTTVVEETAAGTETTSTSIVSKLAGNEQLKTIASEGVTKLAGRAVTGLSAGSTASATGGAATGKTWLIVLSVVFAVGAIGVVLFVLWHKSRKENQAAVINSDRDRADVTFAKQ